MPRSNCLCFPRLRGKMPRSGRRGPLLILISGIPREDQELPSSASAGTFARKREKEERKMRRDSAATASHASGRMSVEAAPGGPMERAGR